MRNDAKLWIEEEHEFLRQNYTRHGAHFCATKLSRSAFAIRRRATILGIQKHTGAKRKYSEQEFVPIVMSSKSVMEVVKKLGMKAAGGSHGTIKKYIQKYNIDTSHFETQADRIKKIHTEAIPLDKILVENSTYSRTDLKKRLYKEGLKQRECELCGQGEEWHGRHMSLILDHINGVNNDNRLGNLRIVCPNCNATLDTHAGKIIKNRRGHIGCIDCNTKVTVSGTRCKPCSFKSESFVNACLKRRKVKDRPSPSQLAADIAELGYLGTGRKYGVSDNAIRKWKKAS